MIIHHPRLRSGVPSRTTDAATMTTVYMLAMLARYGQACESRPQATGRDLGGHSQRLSRPLRDRIIYELAADAD